MNKDAIRAVAVQGLTIVANERHRPNWVLLLVVLNEARPDRSPEHIRDGSLAVDTRILIEEHPPGEKKSIHPSDGYSSRCAM